MMDIRVITAIGLGVVAVGVGTVMLLPTDAEHKVETLVPNTITQTGQPSEVAETQGFESMAVKEEIAPCKAPRPPSELSAKPYIRNSYAAILDIMAGKRWQETGSCECFRSSIPWADVVSESVNFETDNTAIPPFNHTNLRAKADTLNAQQQAACSK